MGIPSLRHGKQPGVQIFDAFVRLAADDPIVFAWPALALPHDEQALLDELLGSLGYFGRAESWVEACRIGEHEARKFNCVPLGAEVDPDTGEVLGEMVSLLVPKSPSEYEDFRQATLARYRKGQVPKKLLPTLPESWIEALCVETADIQRAGWSEPPAAKTVDYRRPLDALKTLSVRRGEHRRTVPTNYPTTARFALYGKPLPRMEEALRVAEAFRRAVMGHAKRLFGQYGIPRELSGHEDATTNGHLRAFWLSDPNEQGEVAHMIVHAPGGLSEKGLQVLCTLTEVRREGADPLRVFLEGVATVPVLAGLTPLLGESAVWRSLTPYLHPWHLKRRDVRSPDSLQQAILGQLQREWNGRGSDLPPPNRLQGAR